MSNLIPMISLPDNEPILGYAPGTPERDALQSELKRLRAKPIEIPLIIGGRAVKTGNLKPCAIPHDHGTVVGHYHVAGKREVQMAIAAALKAREEWAATPWQDRLSVFLKCAELLAGPRRITINAATMLGMSKNPFQAEIDCACELIDFFRFNAHFATQLYAEQPPHSPNGILNRLEYRPLEGFVFAVTPFNFLSIAGNLPSAPAMLGNVAVWKPASNCVYPAYYLMKLFQEAGVPRGVINFIPGPGSVVGPEVMASPDLGGVHFTGSTAVFQDMWQTIGNNIAKYKSYPRIVGETGGKDFVVAHKSADIKALGVALIRGAFEYQGQKCSAASRAYVPKSVWPRLRTYLLKELATVKMGDVEDFSNLINAVIDKSSFDNIRRYINYGRRAKNARIICGGKCDDRKGYFVEPTIIVTTDPHFKTMEEEIFGPVLTVYVYADNRYEETLRICDRTSPYALTGAVFARDRDAIAMAHRILVNAAGNFYINDKPTGAVVGQQPFGGARASGTNDKAGSFLNLIRWVSPRTVKENFVPAKNYRYQFMG